MTEQALEKGHDAHAGGHDTPDDGRVHSHISSLGFYVGIFLALICFTLLTVAASDLPLGKMNLVVAVVIASMKASLVVLFFMHLRYDSRFHAMILVVSLLFIGVFFAYTMNDTERRGEVDLDQGVKVFAATGLAAPGGEPEPSPSSSVVESPKPPVTEK
jgi:cytochrome c oxidase subunit IV